MGFLGKNTRQGGLDIGGLANLIGGFNNQVQQQQPEQASIFSKLLDQNGDGNIMDDVTNIGMNLFKNFMK